jgi:hypothetical protein
MTFKDTGENEDKYTVIHTAAIIYTSLFSLAKIINSTMKENQILNKIE